MIESGRLIVMAAATRQAACADNQLRVTYQSRGKSEENEMTVRRVINCTGPQGNLAAATDPLLRQLSRDGIVRSDRLNIGIDVDDQSRTIASDGTRNDDLYAIGPMTRGEFWEIVAVPDIRQQVWALARRLSNAHWVGGEGL